VIPIEKERRALRLLAGRRLSQRRIGQVVGIARGTVARLKRIGHERPRGENKMWPPARLPGPVERCAGCGRMIEMPCLACQAEAHRASRPARKFPSTPAPASLAPELDEEQQARLDSLRAAKISQGEFPRPGPAPIEERVLPQDVFDGVTG